MMLVRALTRSMCGREGRHSAERSRGSHRTAGTCPAGRPYRPSASGRLPLLPISAANGRGTLTSDGRANVQDCWKGQEPELST